MKKTDTFTKTYLSRLFNSNLGRYNEIDEELNMSLTYQNIPCAEQTQRKGNLILQIMSRKKLEAI